VKLKYMYYIGRQHHTNRNLNNKSLAIMKFHISKFFKLCHHVNTNRQQRRTILLQTIQTKGNTKTHNNEK